MPYTPDDNEASLLLQSVESEQDAGRRTQMVELLGRYRDQKKAAGLEPFQPDPAVKRQTREKFDGIYAGLDQLDTHLDPGVAAEFNTAVEAAVDRDEAKARMVNQSWVISEFPDLAEAVDSDWTAVKHHIANQLFGDESMELPDTAFYSQIGGHLKAKAAEREMLGEVLSRVQAESAKGTGDWLSAWKTAAAGMESNAGWDAKNIDVYRDAAKRIYDQTQETTAELRPAISLGQEFYRLATGSARVLGKTDAEGNTVKKTREEIGAETKAVSDARSAFLEELMRLPKDKREQALTLAIAGASDIAPKPGGEEGKAGVVEKLVTQFERAIGDFPRNIGRLVMQGIRASNEQFHLRRNAELGEDRSPMSRVYEQQDLMDRTEVLRQIDRGLVDSVDPVRSKSRLVQGLYDAIESVPYMVAAGLNPEVGIPLTLMAMAEDNRAKFVDQGMPAQEAAVLALAAAAPQVAIERLQANMVFRGKLPGVEKWLTKAVGTKLGLATKMLAVGGVEVGQQNAEEALQDIAPAVYQEIASTLSEDVPDVDWNAELAQYSGQRLDTFFALLPMVLVGTGTASFKEAAYGRQYLSNKTMLKAAGFNEQTAEEIAQVAVAGDVEKAQGMVQAGWDDPTKRAKALAEKETAEARDDLASVSRQNREEQLAAFAELDAEMQKSWAEQSDPSSARAVANEDGTWSVLDSEGGIVDVVQTPEAALGLVREVDKLDSANLTDVVDDMIDYFKQRGRGGEIEKTNDIRTLGDDVDEGRMSEDKARELVNLYIELGALPEGTTPREARIYGESARVYNAKKKVFEYVSRLHDGADPLVLVEEEAEGYFKQALDDGQVTIDQVEQWRSQVEGKPFESKKTDSVRRREATEWFSAYAKAYLTGKTQDTAPVPGTFRRWLEKMKKVFAEVFQLARNLIEMERAGKLPEDFQRHLARSVGLDDAFLEGRLREDERAKAAEPNAGQYSARQALKEIKLPTPKRETVGMRGELHNLWEGLKFNERMELFSAQNKSLDAVAELLRVDFGFSWVKDADDVVKLAEDVFLNGEQIFADGDPESASHSVRKIEHPTSDNFIKVDQLPASEEYAVVPKGDEDPLSYGQGMKFYLTPDGRWVAVADHEDAARAILGKDEGSGLANQKKLMAGGWVRVVDTGDGREEAGESSPLYFTNTPSPTQLRELRNTAIEYGRTLINDVDGRNRVVWAPEGSSYALKRKPKADQTADLFADMPFNLAGEEQKDFEGEMDRRAQRTVDLEKAEADQKKLAGIDDVVGKTLKPNHLYIWGNDWTGSSPVPALETVEYDGDPLNFYRDIKTNELAPHVVLATDASGKPSKVISANGKNIADFGTPQAQYIAGDVWAIDRALKNEILSEVQSGSIERALQLVGEKVQKLEGDIQRYQGYIAEEQAKAVADQQALDSGKTVKDLDFRYPATNAGLADYVEQRRRRIAGFGQTINELNQEISNWKRMVPRSAEFDGSSFNLSPFYSRLNRTVEESKQNKASGAQWKAMIRNSKIGISSGEYALVGVDDLEDGKTYTKEEILQYLTANQVQVKTVELGGESAVGRVESMSRTELAAWYEDRIGYDPIKVDPTIPTDELRTMVREWIGESGIDKQLAEGGTHFESYTLPGAVNGTYREVLLTVPHKIVGDEKRVDVFGRYNRGEITYEQSVKEIPLGWVDGHSQYDAIKNPIVRLRINERRTSDGGRMLFIEELQAPQKANFEKMPELFQKNWRDIGFKWALRRAVEGGYDSVGWTTGDQQADRYDLSKQVDGISWFKRDDGYYIQMLPKGRNAEWSTVANRIPAEEIEQHVGKEIAQKILNDEGNLDERSGVRFFDNVDMNIGGEGLRQLYDKDFRNVVNKLPAVKRSGQKVTVERVPVGDRRVFDGRATLDDVRKRVGEIRDAWEGPNRTPEGWRAWNVGLDYEVRAVIKAMERGMTYADAMTELGSRALAEKLGGEFTGRAPIEGEVHSLAITPEMRAMIEEGQPTFSLAKDGSYKPGGEWYHGTDAKEFVGGRLARYEGGNGSDMGGIFLTDDSVEGKRYAAGYGRNLYKVEVNLPEDQVFNLSNPVHVERVRGVVLDDATGEDMLRSAFEADSGGSLDWAVVEPDVLEAAGFKAAILMERPPGVFGENAVRSLAVFDPAVISEPKAIDPEETSRLQNEAWESHKRYMEDRTFSVAPATDTEAFKRWFGDSKVVDAEGRPLVVYHGTKANTEDGFAFDYGKIGQNGRGEGAGFYFTTDKRVASGYGLGGSLIEAYLSIQKPMRFDQPAVTGNDLRELVERMAEIELELDPGLESVDNGWLADYGGVEGAVSLLKNENSLLDQLGGIQGSGVGAEIINRAVRDVLGFDGIESDGFGGEGKGGGKIYVAMFPEQVKSVRNRGTFDAANPDITYSLQKSNDGKLLAVHNTHADRLRQMDELGGIAVPSIAVIRPGVSNYTAFGDISLIAPPSLIDPRQSKKAKVFNTDIYSPRFPGVRYVVSMPRLREAWKKLGKASEAIGVGTFSSQLDESQVAEKGLEAFEKADAVQVAYALENGAELKPVYRQPEISNLPDYLLKYEASRPWDMTELPGFEDDVKRYWAEEREDLLKRVGQDIGEPPHNYAYSVAKSILAVRKPEISTSGMVDQAREWMDRNGKRKDFFNWIRREFSDVIARKVIREYNERRERWETHPYTLDAAVKLMKRSLQDGEGFNYGVGSIRATVARQFPSLSAMRDEADAVRSPEEVEGIKEGFNKVFGELAEELKPYYRFEANRFGYYDEASQAFKELRPDGRGIRKWEENYKDTPPELLEKVKTFLQALAVAPTEYFEGKIQRGVQLSEMAGAVIPSDTEDDIRQILNKHGIRTVEYEAGNKVARQEAIKNFGQQTFSVGPADRAQKVRDAMKPRMIGIRVKASDAFSDEMKKQMGDLRYKVRGMDVNEREARELIQKYDNDLPRLLQVLNDPTQSIHPATKVALAFFVAEAANKTGDYSTAAEVAKQAAMDATSAGQSVNELKRWSIFSQPETCQQLLQSEIERENNRRKEKTPAIKEVADTYAEIQREARKLLRGWLDEINGVADKTESELEEIDASLLPEVTFSLSAEVKNSGLVQMVARMLKNSGAEAAEKALVERYGAAVEKHIPAIFIEAQRSMTKNRVKGGRRFKTRIPQMADEDIERTLGSTRGKAEQQMEMPDVDQMRGLGMTEDEIEAAMNRARAEGEMDQNQSLADIPELYEKVFQHMMLRLADKNVPVPQGIKDQISEVLNMHGLQATKADVDRIIGVGRLLPNMTPAQAEELANFAKRIASTPIDSFERGQQTMELFSYVHEQLAPYDLVDVAFGLWYANVLSSLITTARNVAGNTSLLFLDQAADTIFRNPATYWPYLQQIAKGAAAGASAAAPQASNTMLRGQEGLQRSQSLADERRQGVLEADIAPLEGVRTISRVATRFLAMQDLFYANTAYEMKARQLAWDQARREVRQKKLKPEQIEQRVAGLLNQATDQIQTFEDRARVEWENLDAQIQGEYDRRNWIARRVKELQLFERDKELVARALDFAQKVTLDYEPEGLLGLLMTNLSRVFKIAEEASQQVQNKPTRLMTKAAARWARTRVIPFMRVPVNVFNRALDYGPVGFARGLMDAAGIPVLQGNTTRVRTAEERSDLLKRAMLGTMAMLPLAILARPPDPEDEPEETPWLQIHGAGSGRYQTNLAVNGPKYRAYSLELRLGDKQVFIDYRLFPLAPYLAAIGSLHDRTRYKKSMDDRSALVQSWILAQAMKEAFLSSSPITSLRELSEAAAENNPMSERAINRTLARGSVGIAANLIPLSGFWRSLDQLAGGDRNTRDTLLAASMAEIPVASRMNVASVDVLGDDMVNRGGVGWLMDWMQTDTPEARIYQAFAEKDVAPTDITRYQSKMTVEDFYAFAKERGAQLKQILLNDVGNGETGLERLMKLSDKPLTKDDDSPAKKYLSRISRAATRRALAKVNVKVEEPAED